LISSGQQIGRSVKAGGIGVDFSRDTGSHIRDCYVSLGNYGARRICYSSRKRRSGYLCAHAICRRKNGDYEQNYRKDSFSPQTKR
jgi:hypothetical protein